MKSARVRAVRKFAASWSEFVRSRTATLRLIFLAFFALFLALVVLAQHFPVRIELKAPFLAILFNDGFVVCALFFPANDFSAFSLLVGSLLHRGWHIGTVDVFFLVFLAACLCGDSERQTGAHHCNCE